MLKNEIKVNGVYTARVGENICEVRVDEIIDRRGRTGFACTNLRTNKSITIKSAQKFRSEVKTPMQKHLDSPLVKQLTREEKSVVAPEYPIRQPIPSGKGKRNAASSMMDSPVEMPRPEKKVVATVHAGGGIYVDIVDTPKNDKVAKEVSKTLARLPENSEVKKVVMDGIIDIATGKATAESVMAKVQKVQTPKNKKGETLPDPKSLPKTGEPGAEYRAYLKFYGYADSWIDEYFATLDKKFQETEQRNRSNREAEKLAEQRRAEKPTLPIPQPAPSTTSQAQATNPETKPATPSPAKPYAAKAEMLPVTNPLSIPVIKTGAGRVTIFGIGVCAIFRWVGHKGFGSPELDVLRKTLGIEGVGQASVSLELNAGKKGKNVPTVTPEQEALLLTAMGKGQPKEEAKSKSPVPKKKR